MHNTSSHDKPGDKITIKEPEVSNEVIKDPYEKIEL